MTPSMPDQDPPAPRLLDAGEAALVVEFGSRVDPAIHDLVLALDDALRARPVPGLCETVPTYRSLMVHYDPLALDRAGLVACIRERLASGGRTARAGRSWTLPCCYDPSLAEDIAEVAGLAGLSVERVADLHAGAAYRVYMYGFAPGFAYLGGLSDALAVSRRATPRPPHPRSALLIGGGLAAVASVPMPTGWYVVACTPERLYSDGREPTFLVETGDTLRFEPVDLSTFAALDARAAAGDVIARSDG